MGKKSQINLNFLDGTNNMGPNSHLLMQKNYEFALAPLGFPKKKDYTGHLKSIKKNQLIQDQGTTQA